ncbi:MAG: alpha/beta hydrolase [Thermoanaerobaculum sp.]|nr:alpha/beta hydrolase [Thermoanaerobaculum sp.]
MSGWIKALIVLAVLVCAGVVGLLWAFFRHPLAFNAAWERWGLRLQGFHRQLVSTSVGPLVAWVRGTGPTVVFLHGAGDQAGTWSRITPSLAKGYRLVLLDLPGHGGSSPKHGPLPLDVVLAGTRQAVAWVAQGQPVVLVGNSLGAWLACLLAAEPSLPVRGLVLVNGGPIQGHYLGPTLAPATRQQAREVMRVLMGPAGERVPGFVLDDVVRQGRRGPIPRLLAALDSWQPYVWGREKLSDIGVPVGLVWGEADQVFDRSYADQLLRSFPNAQVFFLPRCGHVPQRQCPKPFAEALASALNP